MPLSSTLYSSSFPKNSKNRKYIVIRGHPNTKMMNINGGPPSSGWKCIVMNNAPNRYNMDDTAYSIIHVPLLGMP